MLIINIKLGSIIVISFANDAQDTKVCKSSLRSKKLLNIESVKRANVSFLTYLNESLKSNAELAQFNVLN